MPPKQLRCSKTSLFRIWVSKLSDGVIRFNAVVLFCHDKTGICVGQYGQYEKMLLPSPLGHIITSQLMRLW